MSKADISAGRAYVSLYVKNDLSKALQAAKRELNEFGSGLMGIGASVTAVGTTIVGTLTGAVTHFANVGSELKDMSDRTGLSTTALVELGFAADMTGGSMESVEGAIKKMQKNLGEVGPESKKVAAALGEIGLSVEQLSGLAPEDQFQAIASGIAGMDDATHQAAVSMALLGGSGTELLPMINNLEDLRAEARELGLAPSPESIAAADEIGDAIDKVRKVIGATVFEVGAALAPMAKDILDAFLTGAKAVKKFVSENKPLIVTVAKVGAVLVAAGSAIMAVGAMFIGAGAAIGGIVSVFSALSAIAGVAVSVMGAIGAVLASILSPVGILVAALVAGAVAWAKFTESGQSAVGGLMGFITETFGGIRTTVTDTMGGIIDAIKAGDLALAGQIAMVGLKLVVAQSLEAIHALFGETIGTIVGQLLNGDFSGAWSTLGSAVLDSWAIVTSGIVNLFTGAANAVLSKWQETVNSISDFILESASEGGVMGWALEQVSGVNMQEEVARGKRIEAERLAKGMQADGGIVDSKEFQHEGLQALKDSVQAAGESANQMMDDAAAATGQAVDDAAAGRVAEASAEVLALQAQLAALKSQASGKVAEMNAGRAEESDQGSSMFGGASGKASAASFSLGALAMNVGRGTEFKQLAEAQKANKFNEAMLDQGWQMIQAMQGLGMHHP